MINVKKAMLFLKNILAYMILLFVYSLAFSRLLPAGVNQYFTQRLIEMIPKPMVLLSIPTVLLYCIVIYFNREERKTIKTSVFNPVFDKKDLPLLLFPLAPIGKYIILNMDTLTVFHGFLVFSIFLVVAFLLTFIVPLAFNVIGSKKFLMIASLSFAFVLFNMASLSSDFGWSVKGSLRIQLPMLLMAFLIPLTMYYIDRKFLNIAVVIFFVAGLIFTFKPSSGPPTTFKESNLYKTTVGKKPILKPDIFLLTYESYIENETLLQHGIDNIEQEVILKNNGFTIYGGNWSLGAYSVVSMDSMLNVTRSERRCMAISGNGAVQNILRDNGYKTYGIFPTDYFFRGVGTFYDYSFPPKASQAIPPYLQLIISQILVGQFRFNAGFDAINYQEYLSKKRLVLAGHNQSPVFLYTHNLYPGHTQNSGKCLGNEIETYKERLAMANKEMREDIEIAIKNNPAAIIIVNGDHGPHLTKNCTNTGRNNQYRRDQITRLDIQDRYGSFLAIRWPMEANIDNGNIEILQDVFPVVFAWIFDDPAILNTRLEQLNISPLIYGTISGARVKNGIIEGGVDDGQPLFKSIRGR